MNTTFKVVFNKARGALMVANEVTSCVQSKGTKTVLASAFAMALIGLSDGASATIAGSDIVNDSVQGYSVIWNSETLPDNTIKITLNKALEDEIQKIGPSKKVESYGLMIKDGATGALENADIVSTTDFPFDSTDQSMNVALGVSGGDVTLKGATTHISATSTLAGSDANNWVAALSVSGGLLNLAADKTEISATSSNKTGKVAYGIKVSGGDVMGSGDFNVTVSSQDKDAYALYGNQQGGILLSGNTTATATVNAKTAHAYAVYLDTSASLTLAGEQNILNGEVSVQNRSLFSIDGNTVINGNLSGNGNIHNHGTLAISGTLSNFTGTFKMYGGHFSLTKENGYFGGRGNVTVSSGTLDVLNSNVTDFGNTYIDMGATLLTSGERAFGVAADADATDLKGLAYKYSGVMFRGSNLAINDAQYTLAWAKKATENTFLGYPQLLLTGTLVSSIGAEMKTIKTGEVVEDTIMSRVHYDATEDNVTAGVQSLDTTVGVQTVSLNKDATKADVKKWLTLVGSEKGGELINAEGKSVEVDVKGTAALTLGNSYVRNTTGSISNTVNVANNARLDVMGGSFNIAHVALSDSANMNVYGNLKLNELDGKIINASPTKGLIFIGSDSVVGNMTVDSFDVENGRVLLRYADDKEQKFDNMSSLVIKSFKDNTVKSDFFVSPGSLLSLGDSSTDAAQSLLTKSGVTLGYSTGQIDSALYVDASNTPLTLNNGMTISSTYIAPLNAHTLILEDGGILLIDAAKVKSSVFGDNTQVIVAGQATVFVDNLTKDGLLLTGTGGHATSAKVRTNDHMLTASLNANGKIEAKVVDTKEDAQITDQGVFEAIKGVYDAGRNNTNATHQADAFASRVAQGEEYFGSMQAANRAATEMRALATMAGVQSSSWDSASLFNDRVQARQSLANLGIKGTGLWADLYASRNKSEGFGGGAGYEADIHGGIFGADTTLQNGLRVGAALTYAKADTDTTGTVTKIKNKSDFVGVSVYGAMPLDRANVMADVTYLYGDHDVKANAGGSWGDTVKTNLFAAGVRTEWLSTCAGVNVMPHVGLRFTTLETDGYEAAFDTGKTRQNIVTLPVGVTLSADLTAGDWTVKPIADFSVVPAIGDRDVDVAYGANQKLAVNVIESGLFNATLGVAAQEGAWTIGVNYRLGMGGNNRRNNSLNANMSYAF